MDRIIILYAKTNIMSNDATNESEKILESLFEPDNAEILVELKDGPKLLSFLTKKIAISKEIPLCCEVNIFPENLISIKFHEDFGFEKIGNREYEDHSVAFFKK